MLIPLAIRRFYGGRVLKFLGEANADYLGPLIDSAWTNEFEKISSGWQMAIRNFPAHDVIHFVKMPEFWGGLNNPLLGIMKCSFQDNAYSSILPGNFDEFRKRLKKKLRQDNNRQRRRLKKLGNLSFQIFDADDEARDRALDVMVEQKRKRYLATGVPDIFSIEEVRRFYKNLFANWTSDGYVHFSVLKLDQEILATHWGMAWRGRFYYIIPTYDSDKWRAYSPGRLLLENLIEWSIEKGFNVFDFTIGGEEYKRYWCDTEMPYFESLSMRFPFGIPYFLYIKLRRYAKKKPKVWNMVVYCYSSIRSIKEFFK